MPITLAQIQTIENDLLDVLKQFNAQHLSQNPQPSFVSHTFKPLSHSSYQLQISLTFQPPALQHLITRYPALMQPLALQYAANHQAPASDTYSANELETEYDTNNTKPISREFYCLTPLTVPLITHTITNPSLNPVPILQTCLLNLLNSITTWTTATYQTLLNTPPITDLPPFPYSNINPLRATPSSFHTTALDVAPLFTFHTPSSTSPLNFILTHQAPPPSTNTTVFSVLTIQSREPNPLLNYIYSFSFNQRYATPHNQPPTPELTPPYLYHTAYAISFHQTILNATPNPSLDLLTNTSNFHPSSLLVKNFTNSPLTSIAPLLDLPDNFSR